MTFSDVYLAQILAEISQVVVVLVSVLVWYRGRRWIDARRTRVKLQRGCYSCESRREDVLFVCIHCDKTCCEDCGVRSANLLPRLVRGTPVPVARLDHGVCDPCKQEQQRGFAEAARKWK